MNDSISGERQCYWLKPFSSNIRRNCITFLQILKLILYTRFVAVVAVVVVAVVVVAIVLWKVWDIIRKKKTCPKRVGYLSTLKQLYPTMFWSSLSTKRAPAPLDSKYSDNLTLV